MVEVDVGELQRAINYLKKINSFALKNIKWVVNDKEVALSQEAKKNMGIWECVGLTNVDFAKLNILSEDG